MNMTGRFKDRNCAVIGGVTVFTYERAKEVYKKFFRRADSCGMEGSIASSIEMDKMIDLGFTAEECEELEIEAITENYK